MPHVRRSKTLPLAARRRTKPSTLATIPEAKSDSDSDCDPGSPRPNATPYYLSEMRGKLLKRMRLYFTRPSVVLFFADGTTYEIAVENYSPRCTSFRAKIELDPRTEDLLQMPQGENCDEPYLETPELDCTVAKAVLHKFKDKAMNAYDLDHWHYENVLHSGVAIKLEWEE